MNAIGGDSESGAVRVGIFHSKTNERGGVLNEDPGPRRGGHRDPGPTASGIFRVCRCSCSCTGSCQCRCRRRQCCCRQCCKCCCTGTCCCCVLLVLLLLLLPVLRLVALLPVACCCCCKLRLQLLRLSEHRDCQYQCCCPCLLPLTAAIVRRHYPSLLVLPPPGPA